MSNRSTSAALADLPNPAALRQFADELRQHTLHHLDVYLEELAGAVTAHGGRVHFAADPAAARAVFERLLRDLSPTAVMLEDAPLCRALRPSLRSKRFRTGPGEMGMVVCSPELIVAETGQVCVLAGEGSEPTGNTRVAILGLDPVVPRLADLGVLLKLISRQATSRAMPRCVRLLGAGGGAAFDLILVAQEIERSWMARLWQRVRGAREDWSTETDWLQTLGRSLKAPRRWECWSRRP